MQYSVRTSIFAKEDRKSITRYLSQYSVNAPVKFRQELSKYIGIVGKMPYIFSVYNANPAFRHIVVFGSYTMFYTVNEAEKIVLIYRILHGSQDIENIL